MVRPMKLTTNMRFRRAVAVSQSGATLYGRTKSGKPLYRLGGGLFRTRDLLKSRARFARYEGNVPFPRAKKLVGLQ